MEIYFVRHGQTDYNVLGKYYGRTDVVLNETGQKQAREIAKFLSGISFDKIITSPLKRAYDTAKIIGEGRQIVIEKEELLCEQNFGIFEGKSYSELQKEYPQELKVWNEDFSNIAPRNGESFRQVRERVDRFVEKLKLQKEEKILIVAHKGTFGHFFASMLELPLEGFWNFVFEQGCYSKVSMEDGYAIIRKINERIR